MNVSVATLIWMIIAALLACLAAGLFISNRKRTEELEEANIVMQDALDSALRGADAKTRFLSQMSHEIRTPMNAIVGLTDLAKAHANEPDMVNDYLTRISSSSKVLLSIINDVLDMSSLETGKIRISESDLDLDQVLDAIEMIYQTQCKSKGLTFILKKNISNDRLLGDSIRLNQVLINLVSNAYKFTKPGGTVELTASEINRKDDNVYIRFTISDTGEGMSEDMKNRLFQPFEQESDTTAKQHGGSGLGLSITKNLVDLMHGFITVDSIKGGGTTFTVDMPFRIQGAAAKEYATDVASLNVLVASGDASIAEYVQMLLTHCGADSDSILFEMDGTRMDEGKTPYFKQYDICFVDALEDNEATAIMLHTLRQSFGDKVELVVATSVESDKLNDAYGEGSFDGHISKPILQAAVKAALQGRVDAETAAKRAEEGDDRFDFTGHRVLLAEDNEINAEIMTEVLNFVNMEADLAENGEEAVELFESAEEGRYSAILMDLQMPIMDGYEATKAIRASGKPGGKTIPIVAQSANAFSDDISASLAAGMNAHIAKPINSKELYRILQKCINKEL